MTRETKIGLLVGLAFIIVIGILLSDYNRIETAQAPLYNTAANVRESTVAPLGASDTRGDVTVVPPPAHQGSPRQPVPLREEVSGAHNAPSSSYVVVKPGTGNPLSPDNSRHSAPEATQDDPNAQVIVGPGNVPAPENNVPDSRNTIPNDLRNVAAQHNEPLVPAGPRNDSHPTPTNPANAKPPTDTTVAVAGKQYTAQPGDTLSRLAGRFMGSNTKANRDAIVKANPSLQKNENAVIVDRVYIIPTVSAATPAAPPPAAPAPEKTKPVVVIAGTDKPIASQPQYWYTVKENDSLWKIAQEQLGDGNAWAAIKELNKDLLKGKEDVRPNMRLKLPAKPVASAN